MISPPLPLQLSPFIPQQACRMVSGGAADGLDGDLSADPSPQRLQTMLAEPTDRRLYAVQYALEQGYTIDEIHRLSRIDRWFLARYRPLLLLLCCSANVLKHNAFAFVGGIFLC